MNHSVNLKLSQQLALTPQVTQSLRLLQLPSIDLEKEVQKALDSNPLLERFDDKREPTVFGHTGKTKENNTSLQSIDSIPDPSYEKERTGNLNAEQGLVLNWQQSFDVQRASPTSNTITDPWPQFHLPVAHKKTLFEHLDWQIQMTALTKQDKIISHVILHSLNEEGYLHAEISEICTILKPEINVAPEEVSTVLNFIKMLDPVGAGARNLGERLSILLAQLPHDTKGLELAKMVVEGHLDLVGTHNLRKLKKVLNVSDKDLSNSIRLITQLNPRIANQFKNDNEYYVIPDVYVRNVNSAWIAELDPHTQIKLSINQGYSDLLTSKHTARLDERDRDFIHQNLQHANLFIKSLAGRYSTLLLVAQAIVTRQQYFFEFGGEEMQPMKLRDIAEELDMHESTISRATSGKYLQSPRGLHELKYFFCYALNATDGTVSSTTKVRSLISKIVNAESKAKPLSDIKIAKELKQQGHIVARRTVAKYRENMQIAPSRQRKSLY